MKNLTIGGKITVLVLGVLLLVGLYFGYNKFFPQKAKLAQIETKATGLPPLSYDKNSNAPFRELPQFNESADVQGVEVRGLPFGWNGFAAANYAVGGTTTSKGSIAEELGLNIKLSVQNSTTEQCNQLYAFAQAYHDGEANPTKGVHFINLMGDGVPNYLTGLNARISKDFGPEYKVKVVTFTGASFGEDFWAVKPKYQKDARGSVSSTVIRDGDWNIAIIKSQLMGWPVNNDIGTYDRSKVNFVAAPNDDYVEAGKMYISGAKVTLHIVENGKLTGKDTTLSVTGVASWFPVDQQLVQGKGGLVKIASTKDYASQMACAILVVSKWAEANKDVVVKMIEAFGRGGDQIKSHDEALKFSSQVSEVVFADKEKTADDWYKAYKGFDLTDDDGNVVSIGGSRAFSLADAAAYTGVAGGTDKYKQIYNTFASIDKEAFPELFPEMLPYEDAVDWSYLKAAYNKLKTKGEEGSVSKVDFKQSSKGEMIGDASYSIQFKLGSSEISPESYDVLNKVVGQLNVASNTFVEIAGHTDNSGQAASNKALSEARAKAVKDYLISKDEDLDDDSKLSSKGYGSTSPAKGLDASDPRNRRVEIKLYKVN
jgi:outer membrane protein OmpA-like peptidoglycan-associated protein